MWHQSKEKYKINHIKSTRMYPDLESEKVECLLDIKVMENFSVRVVV